MDYYSTLTKLINQPVSHDRTGFGTRKLVGNHIQFDLKFGEVFPVPTARKIAYKSAIAEMLGFVRGADSAAQFRELGCNFWNANANEQTPEGVPDNTWLDNPMREKEDDLGRIYGVQWRRWRDVQIRTTHDANLAALEYSAHKANDTYIYIREIDQLREALDRLTLRPNDRRAVVTAWNPSDLHAMALPPCHITFTLNAHQLNEHERIQALNSQKQNDAIFHGRSYSEEISKEQALDEAPHYGLSLSLFQRSVDFMLGAPCNIVGYSALLIMLSRVLGMAPYRFYYTTADTHLYENHVNGAKEMLNRHRNSPLTDVPRLVMNPEIQTLEGLERATLSDFKLKNYHNLGPLQSSLPMNI